MQTITDIRYSDAHRRCLLDLHLPDSGQVRRDGKIPLFVDFHGGGLTGGDKEGRRSLAAELAEDGIALAAVRYRLYPDAKYPDFIIDAAAATAWAVNNFGGYVQKLGTAAGIFAGGESAGGYLSMMLCFDGKYLGAHGIDSASLAGYIHATGQSTVHFNVVAERGLDSRRVIADEAAPVYHIGSSEKVAPMIFIASDADIYNRLEQNRLAYRTLLHFYPDADAKLIEVTGGHGEFCRRTTESGKTEYYHMVSEFITDRI